MRNLEQIIRLAYDRREDIADEMHDAFSNTISYKSYGKYYPATRWEPEEYPDFEIFGYAEYFDMAVHSVLECLGDSWDNAEEQLVADNIEKIMNEIDVDYLNENKYEDKGIDYAIEHYWEDQDTARIKAEDAYYERLIDKIRENR